MLHIPWSHKDLYMIEQLNPSEVAQKAIHVVQGPEVTRCGLGRIVMEKFIAGENVKDPGVIFKSKSLKK